MSKSEQTVEVAEFDNLSKKEVKELEAKVALQKSILELEKEEISVETARLNSQLVFNKYAFAERGVADGVFHLTDEVSPNVVDYLSGKIDAFVHYYADHKKKDKPGITLVISSPGGSVFDGFRLFDDLRAASEAGHHVTTVVRGFAASMAGVILQAGDTRLVGPESYVMIHEPSSWAIGKASKIKDEARFLERIVEQMVDIFARKSNLKKKDLLALFDRKDAWLDASECLKLKLADRLG